MSNGRSFRRRLVDLLGPLDGLDLPGGCPDCTATQSIRAVSGGVWQLDIIHEPTCPALAARTNLSGPRSDGGAPMNRTEHQPRSTAHQRGGGVEITPPTRTDTDDGNASHTVSES